MWHEIFLNSYYYGRCMLQLFVCKVQMLFQEFWKAKSLLVEQPNGYSSECILTKEFGKFLVWQSKGFSYECILTQEFGKFLVTWVAAKWFLFWVYSEMIIQTLEFGKFLVTRVATKWKISCRMSGSQMVFHMRVFWHKRSEIF